ncbi:MAG TPA: PilN domain-containing protein [Clostridiales bacterium]|nr:PilN domain-containing protein [Clostridiales bacterium]
MHDINLIPQKKEKKSAKSFFTLMVLLGICAIIVAHGYGPYVQWHQLRYYYNNQKKILGQYETVGEDFDQITRELTELRQKKESLSHITEGEYSWSSVLSQIEKGIPPSTILTSMVYNNHFLTIEGKCPTDIEAAQLATYLQNTGLFKDVNIESIIEDMSSRKNVFIINCSLAVNTKRGKFSEEGEG